MSAIMRIFSSKRFSSYLLYFNSPSRRRFLADEPVLNGVFALVFVELGVDDGFLFWTLP